MKRQSWMLAVAAVVALLFLLTLGAPLASADSTSFTLSNSNLGSSLTGPFGTVGVSLSGSTATITFTAASGYVFMDHSIGDLNINGTWTLGPVTGITCATTGCNGGSGNVDGFGTFNQTINAAGGFGSAVSSFSFTITEAGTTNWGSAAGVLFANSTGGDVAAHIAPTSLGGACTGFASNGTTTSTTPPSGCTTSVPDGGETLMLLGGVLVGLETLRRRFRI
jgi:hypothetical protein